MLSSVEYAIPPQPIRDVSGVMDRGELWEDRLATVRLSLAVAHEEIERLYAMLRPLGDWAVFTDTSGVVVHRRCQPPEAQLLDSLGVLAGGRWLETAADSHGTGVGCLPVEPADSQRGGHSDSRHRSLNSVRRRICNADGQLLGSLGAFARATDATDAALSLVVGLVADWASAIEERLFRDAYSDAWVLCIDVKTDERAQGLLAIDCQQNLLAANAVARQTLGLTDHSIGKQLESLRVGCSRVPSKAGNPRGDAHVYLHLPDKRCSVAALITAPIEVWSTTEFRQFRTRPRVLMPCRSHPLPQPQPRIGGLPPHVLSAIQRYIGSHLAENMSVSALADKAGLSRNYFLSAFSKSTGVTPHRYIVQQRNAKAAEMLTKTDMELADIAFTVGFADQSHFTRSFSRLMDCTPSAFRRRHRSIGAAPPTIDQKHQYQRI
jgi:AraC-like DNA-binding protein